MPAIPLPWHVRHASMPVRGCGIGAACPTAGVGVAVGVAGRVGVGEGSATPGVGVAVGVAGRAGVGDGTTVGVGAAVGVASSIEKA